MDELLDAIYEVLDTGALPIPVYEPTAEEIDNIVDNKKENYELFLPYLIAISEAYTENKDLSNKINELSDRFREV